MFLILQVHRQIFLFHASIKCEIQLLSFSLVSARRLHARPACMQLSECTTSAAFLRWALSWLLLIATSSGPFFFFCFCKAEDTAGCQTCHRPDVSHILTVLFWDHLKQDQLLTEGVPFNFFSELGHELTLHCLKAALVGFMTRTKSFPTIVSFFAIDFLFRGNLRFISLCLLKFPQIPFFFHRVVSSSVHSNSEISFLFTTWPVPNECLVRSLGVVYSHFI